MKGRLLCISIVLCTALTHIAAKAWVHHYLTTSFTEAGCVAAIDLDDDLDIDILAGGQNAVSWWQNDGNQVFTQYTIGTSVDQPRELEILDFDSDGDMDFVIGGFAYNGGIYWYENDGNESFTVHPVDPSASVNDLQVIDLDQDGDTDIVAVISSSVKWLENLGDDLNFELRYLPNAGGSGSACAVDIDQDGDIDILGTKYILDEVNWYVNDGHMNYTCNIISDSCDTATDVIGNDFDTDGDLDVLVGWDDGIYWFINDGNQQFTQDDISTWYANATNLQVIDVDEDGYPDVNAVTHVWGKFVWFENLLYKEFDQHYIAGDMNGVIDYAATDINGDCHLDYALCNSDPGKVVWYENDLEPPTVKILLEPVEEEIIIPATGGSFSYLCSIYNCTDNPVEFDYWMWSYVNYHEFGPFLLGANLQAPPNTIVERELTQRVPAVGPAGSWDYECSIGTYPEQVVDYDQINLYKESGDNLGSSTSDDWLLSGWDESDERDHTPLPIVQRLISISPNPFNPATVLSYELRVASVVNLTIYDISGRQVTQLVNGWRDAGAHDATFDGSGLASGIYIYRLEAGDHNLTEKMMLIK